MITGHLRHKNFLLESTKMVKLVDEEFSHFGVDFLIKLQAFAFMNLVCTCKL